MFTEWIILSTWLLNFPSAKVSFWWIFTWDTGIITSFTHLESSSHIYLPQISFSPIFWSCSFQIPDHPPSNPLATAHESMDNHTSTRFSFQTNYLTMGTAQIMSIMNIFFSGGVFQSCPRKSLQLSTSEWCQHKVQYHQQTRPLTSLPWSTNLRAYPMRYMFGSRDH